MHHIKVPKFSILSIYSKMKLLLGVLGLALGTETSLVSTQRDLDPEIGIKILKII